MEQRALKWVRLQKQQCIDVINAMKKKTKKMNEGWSEKYKKSIDCNNPDSRREHIVRVKRKK